jgi:hypothetical protein
MTENNHIPPEQPTDETTNENVEGNPLEQFIQHQRRAVEETGKALETFLPPGFKDHSSEAGRQFVQGFKVLVDAAIKEMEKASKEFDDRREKGSDDRPSTTGRAKVKVEVE